MIAHDADWYCLTVYANKGVPIPIVEGVSFIGPEIKFGTVLYMTTLQCMYYDNFYHISELLGLCICEHKLQLQAHVSIPV